MRRKIINSESWSFECCYEGIEDCIVHENILSGVGCQGKWGAYKIVERLLLKATVKGWRAA